MRVLLVEDDPELARTTVQRLADEHFVVDHVATLADAIEAVIGSEFRVVLLDRRLPDGDGLSLLPVIRTRVVPPSVIFLTALSDIPERVAGLEAGAEDYLVKPFAFAELLARLRVLLRRSGSEAPSPTIGLGALKFDVAGLQASVSGRPLPLPRRETAILDTLIRRQGRVVLREHLEAQVYGFDEGVASNALEAHVSRLRRRLNDSGAGVELQAVRGLGYILRGC